MKNIELHHAKTGLNVFVVVIPKEGFTDTSPGRPSFGMTTTKILTSVFA